MMAEDRSQTLTFLYKVIDDNQATIRFLDTKAAFGIAVLGAMVGKLLDRDQLVACASHGLVVIVISAVFALLVVIAATLGYKTVFPTVNPAQNASIPDNLEPKFFISKFSPKRFLRLFSANRRFVMLETTHAGYCAALKQATAENLESIAAAEVLKLSFIRQLKTDRLAAFATVLIPTVILFIVVILAAPKAVAEKPIQATHELPPTVVFQGPGDVYNCAPPKGELKP
jgi:hypothetical protein